MIFVTNESDTVRIKKRDFRSAARLARKCSQFGTAFVEWRNRKDNTTLFAVHFQSGKQMSLCDYKT